MSPEAASTAKTAIYVVGGLLALTTVAGIVIFAVGASAATNAANGNGKTLATGSVADPIPPFVAPQNEFLVISYVNGPYPLPTIAQAQAALDATSPGMWQVTGVQEGGGGTWQHQGAFDVSATYLGGPSTYVTSDSLINGWASAGVTFIPNTPSMAVTAVQDFGPASTGAGADPAVALVFEAQ
jgi:hypothetical protein